MSKPWLKKKWAKRRPMPGAEGMAGGSRKGITIHDEGATRNASQRKGDVTWLADYVNSERISYHLIYNPDTGQWIQMIPFDKAARSMMGGDVDGRGNSANRAGTYNIQVCLAGYNASHGGPKPDWKKAKNLWVFAELMDRYGIPAKVRSEWGSEAGRSKKAWMAGGIQGHRHGPHDDHTDPGVIDVKGMLAEARKQQAARKKKK
jgi:hypothetical protein